MNDRLNLALGDGFDDVAPGADGVGQDSGGGDGSRSPAVPSLRAGASGESVTVSKLRKRLHRQVGQAIADFQMIEAGDKVMVCLSGGKDSYGLLDILLNLRRRAPVPFDIVAVNLDQKQPGFPAEVLPNYLKRLDIPFHIETQDTYSIVKRLIPEGRTMCSLCSRLRRGILYRVASELGATKIALGHHRDDMVVTLLMNMFFGSRMKGMPPKLVSDDGRHVVIRPLAYVAETDLERWAAHRQFPIIPCTLCGSQDNLQRVQVKAMIRDWERQYPGRTDNMLNAMAHVVPSHLMDRRLHPFETLKATGVPDPEGDRAFDDDEPCVSASPRQGGRPAEPQPVLWSALEDRSSGDRGQSALPAAIRADITDAPPDRVRPAPSP